MSSDWFAQTQNALARLQQQQSLSNFEIQIGTFRIAVYYTSDSDWIRFKRAFFKTHNTISAQSDLTIFCLSGEAHDIIPTPPWPKNSLSNRGQVQGLTDTQTVLIDQERGQLRAIDLTAKWAFFYVEDLAQLPIWEYYSPLKELIHLWGLSQNLLLLHAGSIAKMQGHLLIGLGGSGKSTTTLHALQSGWRSCGDDYVVIDVPKQKILALYKTLKWKPNSQLPELKAVQQCDSEYNALSGKHVYFLEQHPYCYVAETPLASIRILSRGNATQNNPCQPGQALMQLMTSSLCQIPYAMEKFTRLARQLINSVPAAEVLIGNGTLAIDAFFDYLEPKYLKDKKSEAVS